MKLTSARQRRILAMLEESEELHVGALADALQVSQETIRRDLKELAEKGTLQRVHGGAVLPPHPRDRTLIERSRLHRVEKSVIAELAVPLLSEGQMVFLGEGTTVLALAHLIVDRFAAVYMTHMVDIAQILAQNRQNQVSLTGGVLFPDHSYLLGRQTLDSVQGRIFDFAVTGTSGIDPHLGFLDHSEGLSDVRKALVKRSRRHVVLADHSKFAKDAAICSFPLDVVDVVVTDRRPDAVFETAFRNAGVALICPDGSGAAR